jgi:hypothetical protein
LIIEDEESLLDTSEISSNVFRTALFTPVDLVDTGCHGDETGHGKKNGKSQSYLPTAHVIVSRRSIRRSDQRPVEVF